MIRRHDPALPIGDIVPMEEYVLLYDVDPGDPGALAAVALLLALVVLVAAWIPARRAVRIDPMAALRTD